MNSIRIEINEHALKTLVRNHLQEKLGNISLEDSDIDIQVKSKQNYRSEWEKAEFRAVVNKSI